MNKKIFWSFQIAYWSVYYLYAIFVVHYTTLIKEDTNLLLLLSYLFLLCYFGIPLSLLAQKILSIRAFNTFSIINMLLVITFISAILANVWVAEIILLDKLYNEILQWFSITRYRIIPFKWRIYFWEAFFAALLLFAWIAIFLFLKFWNQWNRQRFEIEKANLQLEVAQLRMLQSQISPHFLFNALSSLRALIRKDSQKAEQMLSKISEFLRYSLINRIDIEVPFSQELQAAENYFSIEKVRFGDKLQIEYHIDPHAQDFPVPAFILHPIIENSVKYGMESSTIPLHIHINARVLSNRLRIEIKNSGRWHDRGTENNGTGTGLRNVRNRLQTLYPERHEFVVDKRDGYITITLEIERNSDDNTE